LHGTREISAGRLNFSLSNQDIERSIPRNLHIGLNKPETILKTSDIEGARPNCVKFKSSRIGTCPLNPSYNLQKVSYVAPEPLKFLRDPLAIDDIQGTRATKKEYRHYSTRDILKIDDIVGT
jgi:hypothetical protein